MTRNDRSGAEGVPPNEGDPANELTLEGMRAAIAETLFMDPSEVGDEDDLADLGLDSVRLMTLAIRWKELGADVAFAELVERAELRHWWELISRRSADGAT